MSYVTLIVGDLLTQNCTFLLVVEICVCSLILPKFVLKHIEVKISFICNNTIPQLTKPVNKNSSPHAI